MKILVKNLETIINYFNSALSKREEKISELENSKENSPPGALLSMEEVLRIIEENSLTWNPSNLIVKKKKFIFFVIKKKKNLKKIIFFFSECDTFTIYI